ncbi:MAG: hypothetical protein JF603_15480, partial [Acidobacteria bacterium]|nr:hypothetical protein [Acidobacteriota bacterium]
TDYRYKGERIPHGDNAPVVPLVPHRVTQVLDGTTYTVAVYVTYLNDDETTGALRVTAITSWTGGTRATLVRQVEVQTIVDALGCESGSTHPFAAPCQPFLYATASTAPGGVTISASAIDPAPALGGAPFDRAVLSLPNQSSNLQSEQSSASQSRVTTSGIGYRSASTDNDTMLGLQTAFASADSDPSQVRQDYDEESAANPGPEASPDIVGTNGTATLKLTTGHVNDSAHAQATSFATATRCPNELSSPTYLTDNQSCATGTTSQVATTTAALTLAGLGTANVAVLSAGATGTNGSAHAKRTLNTNGSASCPAPDGCVRAAIRRSIGFVGLGGLPTGLVGPLGFDYLVKIQGINTTATAEAGVGNAPATVTRAGTISYWNGTAYVAVDASASASAPLPIPTVSLTDPLTSTTITISASTGATASLATGGWDAPACASPCAAAAAHANSPVIGDITYRVVVAGRTVVNLNLHVDLGTLTASTTYTAI